MDRQLTFCIMGGAQDTGNLGVSALGVAVIQNLNRLFPNSRIVLQQQGSQPRQLQVRTVQGSITVDSLFLHSSDRFRERNGTKLVLAISHLQKIIPGIILSHLGLGIINEIREVDFFFDISGGDSFASIYGDKRFRAIASFKRIPLFYGKPLILLPQTFGPFLGSQVKTETAKILTDSVLVTTREKEGCKELKNYLETGTIPVPCVTCPDVAFTLVKSKTSFERFTSASSLSTEKPILGLNISGLLYATQEDFGISLNYIKLINNIITWFTESIHGRVLLIPHVIEEVKKNLSREKTDTYACKQVIESFKKKSSASEIEMVEGVNDPCEIKYVIGECDFFIGSRMHACIAATSQGVPTVALAYSKKFKGVFEMAGMDRVVYDLRSGEIGECLNEIQHNYAEREILSQQLSVAAEYAKSQVERYFDVEVAGQINKNLGID